MWGSGWIGQLKRAAWGLGGFAKHALGATYDLATADLESSGDEWNKMLAGLSNFFGGTKRVLGPVGDGIAWAMQKNQELYSAGVSRPLSTLITAGSLADSKIWRQQQGRNGFTIMFDPDTWKKAWTIAHHRSPGQALILTGSSDIMDPNEVQDYQRGFWFHLLSGSADAVFSLQLDPLGKAGDIVKAAGATKATRSLPEHLSAMGATREVDRAARAEAPSNTRALPQGGPTPDFEFANPRTAPPEDMSLPTTPALEQGGPMPNWRFGQRPEPPTIPGEVEPMGPGRQLTDYISAPKSPIRKTLEWAENKVARLNNPDLAAKAIEKHPMLRESP
ncbi:MAG TPA: hypothetical protein VFS39_18415, partial [Nitrospira sp.]|nr:hypothetical protein [Nitrospira sp.]